MYFKPNRVELYEVLPKTNYEKLHPQYGDRLWTMFDLKLIVTLDRLRTRYGPVYLNNWYWGGKHQYRGYRPERCTVGSKLSMHKYCKALDMTFRDYSADEIRLHIVSSPYAWEFEYISAIEEGVHWLHIDTRQTMGMVKSTYHGNTMIFFRRQP